MNLGGAVTCDHYGGLSGAFESVVLQICIGLSTKYDIENTNDMNNKLGNKQVY
jgi:Mg2+/Co2+ transporter CorC